MESRVKGASIFITGANGGIGLKVVEQLIKKQARRIAMACRTMQKATEAKNQLTNNSTLSTQLEPYGGFDMNDEESIKQAVSGLPKDQVFDIVFLQSGGMVVAEDFQFIESKGMKIEKTIYQNVIGAYLTLLHLERRGLIAHNARIVFAGGEGARGIPGMIDKPVFKSKEELLTYLHQGAGKYSDIQSLGVSKFMSALLVQQLAQMDNDKEFVWFSPGLTAGTKGLINVGQPKRFIMEKIGFPLMELFGLAQNLMQAAVKNVDCLDGIYGKSGDLIGAPEGKALGKLVDQKPMNEGFTNLQFRKAFWELIVWCCGDIRKENLFNELKTK